MVLNVTLTMCRAHDYCLVAALFFGGNYALICTFLSEQGYMQRILSPSGFNGRLHHIHDLVLILFAVLTAHWKYLNAKSSYIIDSLAISTCDNTRIR